MPTFWGCFAQLCLPNLIIPQIMQSNEGDEIILPALFNTENRLSFWNCFSWTVRKLFLPQHIVCIIYPVTVFSHEWWNEMFSDVVREPSWIIGTLLLTGWKPLAYVLSLVLTTWLLKKYLFDITWTKKAELICLQRIPWLKLVPLSQSASTCLKGLRWLSVLKLPLLPCCRL